MKYYYYARLYCIVKLQSHHPVSDAAIPLDAGRANINAGPPYSCGSKRRSTLVAAM